jgi:putative endonuclease
MPAASGQGSAVKTWVLYLLECKGGSLYAGITNDLEARYAAHKAGKGARYTRARPPMRLIGVAPFPDRSSASKAEWQIKQLPKAQKRSFLADLAITG